MIRAFVALAGLALATACAHQPIDTPEPVIKTVEVKIATPVPCGALAKLGAEPAYADSDAAIAAAEDIWEVSKLYAKGRLQRIKRLAEYGAAKAACTF